jgi:hypothetical protein
MTIIRALREGHLGAWIFVLWFSAVCIKAIVDYI